MIKQHEKLCRKKLSCESSESYANQSCQLTHTFEFIVISLG